LLFSLEFIDLLCYIHNMRGTLVFIFNIGSESAGKIMEDYRSALEAVAQKEFLSMVCWTVILTLIVVFVWFTVATYFWKEKRKNPKRFASAKQQKLRRQSYLAAVGLSVISIVLGLIFNIGTVNTLLMIQDDLRDNTFVTFSGDYFIESSVGLSRNTLYDRWLTVNLDDGELVFLYMNDILDWLATEEGDGSGIVIYGENSRIVVSIEE
jgi:hypothetical protein